MKITDIKCYLLSEQKSAASYGWRKNIEFGDGIAVGGTSYTALVRVETDEGLCGFTTIGAKGFIVADIVRRRFHRFLGRDPLMTEQLWQDLWELDRAERLQVDVFALVDIACWDIKSQKAGIPLYKLIGGNDERVRAYASTVTWHTMEEYERHIKECVDVGFTAFKLHGWGDLERDIELSRNLRRWVGDDAPLMFDASAGFSFEESVAFGRALEDLGYYWLEEPLREYNLDSNRRLCEHLDIAVLGAETVEGAHWSAASWISTGACDMIRTCTSRKAGITGALKVAHLAEAFGMKAQVLHEDGCIDLHLCAGIANNDFYEQIVFGSEQIRSLPDLGETRIVDGYLTAPDRPGIDPEPDWSEIERRAEYIISAREQNDIAPRR